MTETVASAKQALDARIQEAFARRDNQAGLQLLRELAATCPEDAEVHHRLGVVEEQLGSAQAALQAHLRSIELAPRNPIAHLYAGFCLHQLGRAEEALVVWSRASDLDARLLLGSNSRDPSGLRRAAAATALRQHFGRLHREATGDSEDVARVRDAIWVQTADRPFNFQQAQQQPHLFYIPGLPAQPWYAPEAWAWSQALEGRTDDILEEFLASQPVLDEHGRPYLGKGMQLGPELAALQGSLNWTALDLYRDGALQEATAQAFPKTLDALADVPLYGLGDNPFEVFLSVLKPGQHIAPHYGLSNHSLTVHLPIIAPPDCSVTVGGERRETRRGQLLAFDDSYLHEARNDSDAQRVVLIFSTWHPDLSDEERSAIRRTFQGRNRWLASRRLPRSE